MATDSKSEAEIVALEKAAWEAFKNKNGSWFQNNLTDDYTFVNPYVIQDKSQIVKDIAGGCEVKSYSLDKFKFVMMTKDSARLTYKATQDAVCDGNALPKNVSSTSVFGRRGGKWRQSLYMETAAGQ